MRPQEIISLGGNGIKFTVAALVLTGVVFLHFLSPLFFMLAAGCLLQGTLHGVAYAYYGFPKKLFFKDEGLPCVPIWANCNRMDGHPTGFFRPVKAWQGRPLRYVGPEFHRGINPETGALFSTATQS